MKMWQVVIFCSLLTTALGRPQDPNEVTADQQVKEKQNDVLQNSITDPVIASRAGSPNTNGVTNVQVQSGVGASQDNPPQISHQPHFHHHDNEPSRDADIPQGENPALIPIISQTKETNENGNYSFSYETGNGISFEQHGFIKQSDLTNSTDDEEGGDIQVVQGAYNYTSPNGDHIYLKYIADEHGFQAQGSHLPTPPPVLKDLARSLSEAGSDPQEKAYNQNQQNQQGSNDTIIKEIKVVNYIKAQ